MMSLPGPGLMDTRSPGSRSLLLHSCHRRRRKTYIDRWMLPMLRSMLAFLMRVNTEVASKAITVKKPKSAYFHIWSSSQSVMQNSWNTHSGAMSCCLKHGQNPGVGRSKSFPPKTPATCATFDSPVLMAYSRIFCLLGNLIFLMRPSTHSYFLRWNVKHKDLLPELSWPTDTSTRTRAAFPWPFGTILRYTPSAIFETGWYLQKQCHVRDQCWDKTTIACRRVVTMKNPTAAKSGR
mmetsp:Transcript_114387/g.198929  ORF Transcript_114387/g.198929 Transcript_114387/m.198929 type:complete len:236 (-) Transcript_114387:115-822(-)